MKPLRLVPLAAAFVLAACGAAPTEPAPRITPSVGPRMDGVTMIGSGNRNDDGGGESAQTFGDGAAQSDSLDSRGPNMIGSGN